MSAGSSERLDHVRDQRIAWITGLVAPATLLGEQPLAEAPAEVVLRGRAGVRDVLDRSDDRLLVVVGPCSSTTSTRRSNTRSAWRRLRAQLGDELLLVMRVYFEKPRTTVGWKGLINDPHLDGTATSTRGSSSRAGCCCDVARARPAGRQRVARPDHAAVHRRLGRWGAIGARTTESQTHRQLASGLSMPVGFKNGTDGDVAVAVNAIRAASVPHTFAGIDAIGRVGVRAHARQSATAT